MTPPSPNSPYSYQARRDPASAEVLPPTPPNASIQPHSHHFTQTFGLHPAMTLLTVVVNTMVFTGGFITGGAGWLLSIPIGLVLGIIVFLGQKKWYGDDNENAIIKALIVAFLTAIPTSLPGYLTIPSGIIGFFNRRKN